MSSKKLNFYQIIFITSSISSIRMLIGATSALYLISRGIQANNIIFLKSLQALLILIADIPFGILSDRINRWTVLLLSSFFSVLWLSITGFSHSVVWLYIAEGFNALGLALDNGSEEALIVESYRENISQEKNYANVALSIANKYSFFGMSIASLLGSFFISTTSNLNWLLASIFMLLTIIYIIVYLFFNGSIKNLFQVKKKNRFAAQKYNKISLLYKNLLLYKGVIRPFIFSIIINYIYQIIIQYWQLLIKKPLYHIPKHTLLSIVFFLILFIQAHISKLVDLSKKSYQFLFGLIFLQLLLLTTTYYFQAFIIVIIIIYYWIFRATDVSLNAKIHTYLQDSFRATALSLKSSITRILLILLAPIVSILLKHSISKGVSLLSFYALLAVSIVILSYKTQNFKFSFFKKNRKI